MLVVGSSLWIYQLSFSHITRVQIAVVERGANEGLAVGPILSGSGYVVTGDRYISIGVQVPGRIQSYEVEEGTYVRRGDILVRLEDRNYRALLRRAQASLELAKANLDFKRKQLNRIQELHEEGLIADQSLDKAKNELAVARAKTHQAEAEVELADVNLGYTMLKAPTTGLVLAKLKEAGEIAVPGGFSGSGDLIRIANLQDLRCEVDISEVDFHLIHMNQKAKVTPDAYPDRIYTGKVIKIYPQVNRQKGTFKVELKLTYSDSILRPDMSVRIGFLSSSDKKSSVQQIYVPKTALHRTGSQTYVWTVESNTVRKTEVEVGQTDEQTVQISQGLMGGEKIVVSDSQLLYDGMRVEGTLDRRP